MKDRLESIWAIGALILGFRVAFTFVDYGADSMHPELARLLCGSILGFNLGGAFAIVGLPVIELAVRLHDRLFEKGPYERTEQPGCRADAEARTSVDSADAR